MLMLTLWILYNLSEKRFNHEGHEEHEVKFYPINIMDEGGNLRFVFLNFCDLRDLVYCCQSNMVVLCDLCVFARNDYVLRGKIKVFWMVSQKGGKGW